MCGGRWVVGTFFHRLVDLCLGHCLVNFVSFWGDSIQISPLLLVTVFQYEGSLLHHFSHPTNNVCALRTTLSVYFCLIVAFLHL